MFLLQLQLYVLTIIRVTLGRIHKPLGESPHFVSLNIPFLVKGTKKVSFISFIQWLQRMSAIHWSIVLAKIDLVSLYFRLLWFHSILRGSIDQKHAKTNEIWRQNSEIHSAFAERGSGKQMFRRSLFRPSRQSNISTSGEERFKYPLPRENKISQMPYPRANKDKQIPPPYPCLPPLPPPPPLALHW